MPSLCLSHSHTLRHNVINQTVPLTFFLCGFFPFRHLTRSLTSFKLLLSTMAATKAERKDATLPQAHIHHTSCEDYHLRLLLPGVCDSTELQLLDELCFTQGRTIATWSSSIITASSLNSSTLYNHHILCKPNPKLPHKKHTGQRSAAKGSLRRMKSPRESVPKRVAASKDLEQALSPVGEVRLCRKQTITMGLGYVTCLPLFLLAPATHTHTHISSSIKAVEGRSRVRQLVNWSANSAFALHRVLTHTVFSTLENASAKAASTRATLASLFMHATIKCLWIQAGRQKPRVTKASEKYKESFAGLSEALDGLRHRHDPSFFSDGVKVRRIVQSIAQTNATRCLVNLSNVRHTIKATTVGLVTQILQCHTRTTKSLLDSQPTLFSSLLNPCADMKKKLHVRQWSALLRWLVQTGASVEKMDEDKTLAQINILLVRLCLFPSLSLSLSTVFAGHDFFFFPFLPISYQTTLVCTKATRREETKVQPTFTHTHT